MESKAKHQANIERKAKVTRSNIFQGKIIDVFSENIHYNDEKTISREFVRHDDAVVIIPVDQEGKLIFVEQYRRAIDKIHLELPAGIIEEGEDPLKTAKRELEEETGYVAQKISPLGGCYSSPGFCDEYLHFFHATDLTTGQINPDEDEAIDVIHLSKNEVLEKVHAYAIYDAKTLAALFYYFHNIPTSS